MTQGKRGGAKASTVYLKAAQAMFNHDACTQPDCGWPCCAISSVLPDVLPYQEYRQITQGFISIFGADFQPHATHQEQEEISLALLFMHHIARDEERGRK